MDQVNVYALKIGSKIDGVLFDQLLSFVTQEKRSRILKFFKQEDAERSLLSDLLVRYLISAKLGIKNHQISIGFNEYGKPFLKNNPQFQYNISHSGEWAVCVTDQYPVGIDVEKIETIDFNIAERFFSRTEYFSLMGKKESERLSYFFDLWTLKESYLKATSKGMSTQLGSFSIIIDNDRISIVSENDPNSYYFKQYWIDIDYELAVCSKNNNFANEVNLIHLEQLVQWFLS